MNTPPSLPVNQGALMFLALFLTASGMSYWQNRPGVRVSPAVPKIQFALQLALFLMASWQGMRLGVFSRELVSPLWVATGLLLGHVLFAISLLATHNVWRDAAVHFFDLGSLARFLAETPGLIGRFLAVSMAEEMIYRVAAQSMLSAFTGKPWLAIVVVAVVFSVVHKHFFENAPVQSVEFVFFSLVLGAAYHYTGSLCMVIVVHTVRNLESVFLEYVIKVQELGDEAEALAQVESAYRMGAQPGE